MADQLEQLNETIELLSDLLHSGQDTEFIESFESLHDFEMAQVYAELPAQFRSVAWRLLSDDILARVFDNLDVDEVDIVTLLQEMPPQRGARILQEMYADNAADLLQEMPARLVATYLSLIPKDEANVIRKLINYDDQTAGSLMSTEYLAVEEDLHVDEVMRLVKKQALEAESISYVYVLDSQDQLTGVISLRDLLTHSDDLAVSEITKDRIVSVKAGDDQEDVAQIVADYNFLSIPVTDDNNRLLGVITVDDIVDVIDEEAVEDYSGLAAVNVSQINDTPWHSAVKRIPWLIALLLLGMTTATLISSYDDLVRRASILAAFISLITGTAGNAGTQALALAVRRIAVGSEQTGWKDFLSEIVAGIIVGIATGVSVFAIVAVWKQNTMLGVAVGLAMTMAIIVANLAGYLIPVVIDKIGFDPAVASGPFITTLSDLTSVLIYFSVAQLFIAHFVGG
ncbi:magnesium transporter [Leuconostoc sp. C2]|uniref:magnesium transporter n=1 Tax=Leuconostoc sp. (strain C2) TaxID=979982 RepID=UPI0002175866|nr:magnesium transporter [Leuconostoc sp. C2]AEJ30731.1 magnesium transporter [Leuconostoc sp. C2]